MLDEAERRFLERQRVGHLATADAEARPHVVPVCYALAGANLYIAIDGKPKSGGKLKRLQNIEQNPNVSLVVDRYDDDWTRLGWVLLHGHAELLHDGGERDAALVLLQDRYPPYRDMAFDGRPVIALRIARVACWGNLEENP
ncbi:MAG: TIGR03668 family PPOX class F420-dependent oxidoreductase [Alphaproteobacteria bacterium]